MHPPAASGRAFPSLATALLTLLLVLSTVRAQITLNSATANCAVGSNDKAECDYVLNYDVAATFTAPPDGPLNNFVCTHPTLGLITLENPVSNQVFTAATGAAFAVEARCDCTSITWSLNGATFPFSNTNPDAVLNSCDFCGPATGNTLCGTGLADECYELGVCSAGVCTQASKCVASNACFTNTCIDPDVGCTGDVTVCPDNLATCQRGQCSVLTGTCTYVDDPTLPGCTDADPGVDAGAAHASPVTLSFETSVDIAGINTEGDYTVTHTSEVEIETDGQIDTSTEDTSSSSYSHGGLTAGGIATTVVLIVGFGLVVTTTMVITSFASITPIEAGRMMSTY